MTSTIRHKRQFVLGLPAVCILLLLICGMVAAPKRRPNHQPRSRACTLFLLCREGYDAKTGKWINKKPSPYAFAVTPEVYQEVKNWYATDSGTNNPDHLPVQVPRFGYTYIYTPYKDTKHPGVTGMSIQGEDGYKGYWYADDLSKATDSTDATGNDVAIPPPKENTNTNLEYGGYNAKTGNWISTSTPGPDAFAVTQGTYERVKNWYTTDFGANNPLNLKLEVPRYGFTYIFVPFKDPKHPGVIGMSFQGDLAFKGYWYADRISSADDTANAIIPVQRPPAPPLNQQNAPAQPSRNNQADSVHPVQNN